MMKKLVLLCLFPSFLSAQSIFVKVGGGLSSQTGASGAVGAAKISFGYEYELSQTLAIAPSFGFTTRGWEAADVETLDLLYDEAGNRLDANGHVTTDISKQAVRHLYDADNNDLGLAPKSLMHRTYTTNYLQLEVPLNYYIRHAERRYVTLTGGVWGAVGVGGKRKVEGDGLAANARKLMYTDGIFALDGANRFDCGLKAGLGYQFPSSLTVNLEGEFSLLKTNKAGDPVSSPFPTLMDDCAYYQATDNFAGRCGRNFAVMLTLSYRLNKTKNEKF